MSKRSSAPIATSRRTRGSCPTARRFSRRCIISSAARRKCSARRSIACARRTSARCGITTASRPRGRSATTNSSPITREAEQLYQVHGEHGRRSHRAAGERALSGAAGVARAAHRKAFDDLTAAGYHPFPAPSAVMLNEADMAYSRCIRCQTCDGFPCLVHAKSDAEVIAVRPALERPNVTLLRNARAVKLETNAAGNGGRRASSPRSNGAPERFEADIVVVSCGAANSAALLLRSANDRHPDGPRQRLGSGRAQLHVSQQPGGAGAVADAERHDVPEDAGAQRFLFRHGGLSLSDGQYPDDRQDAGRHVSRREAAADRARARIARWRRSRATPSISG